MVLGSELAMPIIVLNMGGEMIYILHQRLQAQQVPEEKSRKVLEGKNILFYDYFFYHIYDLQYFLSRIQTSCEPCTLQCFWMSSLSHKRSTRLQRRNRFLKNSRILLLCG